MNIAVHAPTERPLTWAPGLPMVLSEVEVVAVDRLSPAFVRLELAGPGLAEVGLTEVGQAEAGLPETEARGAADDSQWWDQRFKLIVPDASGAITTVEDADETWLSAWAERPVSERGHMRTYTIRQMYGTGTARRLIVDIVLHPDEEHPPGPGARWAEGAVVGSRGVVLLPRRGHAFGGIEFVPGSATDLVLVGDETAVPAICAILENLPEEAQGAAFLEVPTGADVLDVSTSSQVEVHWLPRDGQARGEATQAAVLAHLEERGARAWNATDTGTDVDEDEVDPDLWETPSYSSSGEAIGDAADADVLPYPGLYAWIAGESLVVTALRRRLVKELGIARSQVAFMGYWRRGVAMKS